jgi:hypothetical protein
MSGQFGAALNNNLLRAIGVGVLIVIAANDACTDITSDQRKEDSASKN